MAISLPSRTAAIIPHPHEQKLQEVVNSLTFESFNSFVAALTAATSISPPIASPTLPPTLALNHSLRPIVRESRGQLSVSLARVKACRPKSSSISFIVRWLLPRSHSDRSLPPACTHPIGTVLLNCG